MRAIIIHEAKKDKKIINFKIQERSLRRREPGKLSNILQNHHNYSNSVSNLDYYENMATQNSASEIRQNRSFRDSSCESLKQKEAEELVKKLQEEKKKRADKRKMIEKRNKEKYDNRIKELYEEREKAKHDKVIF